MAAMALLGASALPHAVVAAGPAGVAAGAALFNQRCVACHTITPGQKALAPNLAGVVGRRAGSTDFAYSPAMKALGQPWTAARLDRFLTAPAQMVPGTRMPIAIADPADRRAIIAFLATTGRPSKR